MPQDEARFDHLDRPGRGLAAVGVRPKGLVYALLIAAVMVSWILLLAMAGRSAVALPGSVGPGGSLLAPFAELPIPAFLDAFFRLCLSPAPADGAPAVFAASATMWFLMALAMMLPSAAPMIRTYCEVADTAAAKGEAVVHPLVLVAGYLTIWLAASLVFAGLALGLAAATGPLPLAGSGVALGLAGAYQFSGLKDACLEKCRNPFAILFARWSTEPAKIFRLGLKQGLYCLGCCWALMLVMFAVGIFNPFWMALIGIFAIVEKQGGRLVTRIAGTLLVGWALALLVVSGQ